MTMKFICDTCDKEITTPGAVTLTKLEHGGVGLSIGCHWSESVRCRHVCQTCNQGIFRQVSHMNAVEENHQRLDEAKKARDAEARRNAKPVEEETPRERMFTLMNELPLEAGDKRLIWQRYDCVSGVQLINEEIVEVVAMLEQRLREKQGAKPTKDPRHRICDLFAELDLSLAERERYLRRRAAETVWQLSVDTARKLVGVLELRLADEETDKKEKS